MSSNWEHWEDISSYQGTNIDTTGIDGFIVKLSQGTNYTNPDAIAQIQLVKKAGCKVAFYHFLNTYSWSEITYAESVYTDIVGATGVTPEFYAWDIETVQAVDSIPTGGPLLTTSFGPSLCVYTNQSLLRQVTHKLSSLPIWLALPQYVPPAEIAADVASEESQNNVDILAVQDGQSNNVDQDYVDSQKLTPAATQTGTGALLPPVPDPPNATVDVTPVPPNTIEPSVTENGNIRYQITAISHASDSAGSGWVGVNIPMELIMSILPRGPYPPENGYTKIPTFALQARNISGTNTQTVITWTNSESNQQCQFFIISLLP